MAESTQLGLEPLDLIQGLLGALALLLGALALLLGALALALQLHVAEEPRSVRPHQPQLAALQAEAHPKPGADPALHRLDGPELGAFADPAFPPPTVSIYNARRHRWATMPGLEAQQLD